MPITLSETSTEWVVQQVKSTIETLLDDPFGVTFEGTRTVNGKDIETYGIKEYIDLLRTITSDLGLDLEQMLSTMGTRRERERLDHMRKEYGCENTFR